MLLSTAQASEHSSSGIGTSGIGPRAAALCGALALCVTSGCVNTLETDPETGLVPATVGDSADTGAVIVGALNWVETTTLTTAGAERQNANKVGYLSIPAKGTRCTAFLIANDVVMTNEHCISSQAQAEGAQVSFRRELGVPWSEMQTYACGTFIGDDAALDFALLRCSGNPGATLGTVALEARNVSSGDPLYVIHQNCDYYTTPGCDPTKKYSPGQVTGVSGDVRHNADTLGGSSGSPVFSSSSHKVFALHHVGVGGNASGRGSYNGAVPMTKILPELATRFPTLVLGSAGPSTSGAPFVGDGFEPNNNAAEASTLGGSFSADGLTITTGDVDIFRLDVVAGARIAASIAFTHAAGDLDVALYAGSLAGTAIAKSDSATDDESIVVENAAAGTYYFVVYGYNGAVNTYDALVTVDGVVAAPVADGQGGVSIIGVPYTGSHAISTAGEIDLFQFTTAAATRTVRIDFTHAVGDLDLYVLNASGAVIGESLSVANSESVSMALAAGTFTVRVIGYQGAVGSYTLRVE
jgi:hypothetical protein